MLRRQTSKDIIGTYFWGWPIIGRSEMTMFTWSQTLWVHSSFDLEPRISSSVTVIIIVNMVSGIKQIENRNINIRHERLSVALTELSFGEKFSCKKWYWLKKKEKKEKSNCYGRFRNSVTQFIAVSLWDAPIINGENFSNH